MFFIKSGDNNQRINVKYVLRITMKIELRINFNSIITIQTSFMRDMQ